MAASRRVTCLVAALHGNHIWSGWSDVESAAARDSHNAAGHVGGGRRQQKGDGLCDVLGLTKPSNWDSAFRAFGQRWADHVGLDQAGRDGVDADALERDLVGDAAGEGFDGALGGCVGDDAGEAASAGRDQGFRTKNSVATVCLRRRDVMLDPS